MKKYEKPTLTLFSFLSEEAISANLSDWLSTNLSGSLSNEEMTALQGEGITNYSISSINF